MAWSSEDLLSSRNPCFASGYSNENVHPFFCSRIHLMGKRMVLSIVFLFVWIALFLNSSIFSPLQKHGRRIIVINSSLP